MKEKIQLVKDTIERDDIDALIEWLKTYPRLTKGDLTVEYEKKWSEWLGVKHTVFVNSGSSALLMMLQAIKEKEELRNNKIVIPQIAWSTDLSSAMILDYEPILCDINMENLSVSIEDLDTIFIKHKPAALMLVSVLGLSPYMDDIIDLCEQHGVILLEDVCESQGTKFGDKKLGTFGKMSAFSTYFGHSMSTIEGGMVCTDDDEYYNLLLQLRSHGWDRDLDQESQMDLRDEWQVDNFNALYTFYVPSFNLRATDLQAFIGLRQLDKIDNWLKHRHVNFNYMKTAIKEMGLWIPEPTIDSWTASFCYPLILPTNEQRERVIKALIAEGIECRPLISGSMGTQPMYIKEYGELSTPNALEIDNRGIYIPNHPKLSITEITRMLETIKKAL